MTFIGSASECYFCESGITSHSQNVILKKTAKNKKMKLRACDKCYAVWRAADSVYPGFLSLPRPESLTTEDSDPEYDDSDCLNSK